jgi:putative transposase
VCGIFSKKADHGKWFGVNMNHLDKSQAMTRPRRKDGPINITKQDLLEAFSEEGSLRKLIQTLLQEALEAEMERALQAAKGERTPGRAGYRSGYYTRHLITRMGKVELRVPQDRQGRFSTELFSRYQRSEKALVSALIEMYVQGVSTRRVKAVTEELCGHEFSASCVSAMAKKLDVELERFMARRLEEEYPYVVMDARYERVREDGVGRSRAVLVTLGIAWDGRRQVLSVELAERESATSWREHLARLKERGLRGVRLALSDDHPGLRRAVMEMLPEARWQRCYVHFLRNARGHLPRRGAEECVKELGWLFERRDAAEARR